MIPVSDQFRAAIASRNDRKTTATVRFEVLDNDAWIDNTKQVSSEASISRADQLTNRVRRTQGALASLEPGRWKLDGSFVIPPKPGEEPDVEIGWWSEALCDAEGYFTPAEGVVITCGALYNAAGLTISFDPASGECAREFTLTIYGADDVLIHEEVVTDNAKAVYTLERNLPRFQRVELEIRRWSTGHRRAKVVEIDFGLVEDYGESELIDLSLITEVDPTGATLPASELRFKLDNLDKRFNILNPSGLYYFLQERQRATVEFGVETRPNRFEMIPAGVYYLSEWKSDEGALTASFVARDAIDLLGQGTYRRGRLEIVSAYDLAVEIIEDAGLDIKYDIDEALQDVMVSACVPIISHREALQLIALATQTIVYADAHGNVVIKRLPTGEPVETIWLENTWAVPAITRTPLIGAVNVDVITFLPEDVAEVYNGTIAANGEVEVWLEYSNPCKNHQIEVRGGTLISAEHYAYASRVVISGSGDVEIQVMAEKMKQIVTTHSLVDKVLGTREKAQALHVSNNPLIHTSDLAQSVATHLLNESRRRLEYDVVWQQNPALECGDLVEIENELGGNKTARIIRQELTYAGFLTGATKAKGGEVV